MTFFQSQENWRYPWLAVGLFEVLRVGPLGKITRRKRRFALGSFNDMTRNRNRKRSAGQYLISNFQDRVLDISVLILLGFSWFFAITVMWFVESQTLPQYVNLVFIVGPGTIFIFVACVLFVRGNRLGNVLKGARSEMRIGQVIENAITRYGCAVAHDVTKFGQRPNIDHLVATTRILWVIETKTSKVPRSRFPFELQKIAQNVNKVRQWMPEVQVIGCIVFVNDPGEVRESYEHDGEPIYCFRSPKVLFDAIRAEAGEPQETTDLAKQVWRLSIDEAEDD